MDNVEARVDNCLSEKSDRAAVEKLPLAYRHEREERSTRGKGEGGREQERECREREKRNSTLIMHRAKTLCAQHIITEYLAFKFREAKMLFNSLLRGRI